ncbi:MAG: hypothetical protein AAF399_12135 [Bacteroidota bacterium]
MKWRNTFLYISLLGCMSIFGLGEGRGLLAQPDSLGMPRGLITWEQLEKLRWDYDSLMKEMKQMELELARKKWHNGALKRENDSLIRELKRLSKDSLSQEIGLLMDHLQSLQQKVGKAPNSNSSSINENDLGNTNSAIALKYQFDPVIKDGKKISHLSRSTGLINNESYLEKAKGRMQALFESLRQLNQHFVENWLSH